MLGLLERSMTPTLDAALLISSRAGADLGRTLDKVSDMNTLVDSYGNSYGLCLNVPMSACSNIGHIV